MASEVIKSGPQVVSEFLDSLQGDESIDKDTLSAVHELFEAGKLTKTRLLNSLEALRAGMAAKDVHAAVEGVPDDD
jgi:hypothetical protein